MYAIIIGHNNKEIFKLNNCKDKLNIDIRPINKNYKFTIFNYVILQTKLMTLNCNEKCF